MDEAAKAFWEFLKNGGALAAAVLAIWSIIKGTFLTRQHCTDVVKVKDDMIASLRLELAQQRADFETRLQDERDNSQDWQSVARSSVGAGAVLSEVVAQKQLPPDRGR